MTAVSESSRSAAPRALGDSITAVLIIARVWACNLLADAIRDVSGEAGRSYLSLRPRRRRQLALVQRGSREGGRGE